MNDFNFFREINSNKLIACVLASNHYWRVFKEIMAARIYVNDKFEILIIIFRLLAFSEYLEVNYFFSDFRRKISARSVLEGEGV